MARRYSYRANGYNPTQDQQPPPRADVRPLLTCGVIGIVVLMLALVAIGMAINGRKASEVAGTQTAIARTPTATLTLNAWDMTGTAIYWLTYTPTPTLETTFTPTSTGTVTPDIPGTITAIYMTLKPTDRLNMKATSRPPATRRPGSSSVPSGSVSTSHTVPQQVPVTRIVPQPVPVTRVVPVPYPVTTTPLPESTQEIVPTLTPTLTPSATATSTDLPTATFTSTPSETPMPPTPTETPTDLPTVTFTPTFTDTPEPTWTLEPTLTLTETPTDIPTEELPS